MNWRRFAWLLILILVTTIVWGVVDLKEAYEKVASAKSGDVADAGQRLASFQRKLADRGEYIESLEKLALWQSGSDLMSYLTQQANESGVQIIGVEHLPVEKVSEYQHIPVKITVRGNYNPLGRFINTLERSPNAVRINFLRMRRKEFTPEHVTIDLSLSYFQKVGKSRSKSMSPWIQ